MPPTLESLRLLRETAPHIEVPARIAELRIISGRLDTTWPADADLVLSGGIVLRAFDERIPGRYWSKARQEWRWRKVGRAMNADREKWPTWDGISDGDPVTRGHLEALRDGGLL